ncbi:hypothetical protein SASPL_158120 [Salvia splendens]|uniref:Uncharacterized protein n=1 Tax=Salvia splendens TaxID=180675 RepID=A0A8X8VTU1_SALSN|nr:hypothetical protein SASPL_158120 [Salvia splendens]
MCGRAFAVEEFAADSVATRQNADIRNFAFMKSFGIQYILDDKEVYCRNIDLAFDYAKSRNNEDMDDIGRRSQHDGSKLGGFNLRGDEWKVTIPKWMEEVVAQGLFTPLILKDFSACRVLTEDTSEGASQIFLRSVHAVLMSLSAKIETSSFGNNEKSNGEVLISLRTELICSINHLLNIEYEVIGDDLESLWMMIFSSATCCYSSMDMPSQPLLSSETIEPELQAYRRIVPLPSSNKQSFNLAFGGMIVDSAIFALCKAVRQSLLLVRDNIKESLEWVGFGDEPAGRGETVKSNSYSSDLLQGHLREELMGKILCEVYAIILDSIAVTSGNSYSIGTSLKSFIEIIRPSLGRLITLRVDSGIEILSKSTGPDNVTICWFLVLLLRLIVSCRSLFRQAISLMPPDASKKMSGVIGDSLTVHCGRDWLEMTASTGEGFLSWTLPPSVSLLDVINSVSDICIQDSAVLCPPLVYVLNVMALQRLTDLNRLIKSSEYMLQWNQMKDQTKFNDDADLSFNYGSQIHRLHDNNSSDIAAGFLDEKSLTSALWRYMASMFCRILQKSVLSLFNTSVVDLSELPDWLEAVAAVGNTFDVQSGTSPQTRHNMVPDESSSGQLDVEFARCQCLLNLLMRMPEEYLMAIEFQHAFPEDVAFEARAALFSFLDYTSRVLLMVTENLDSGYISKYLRINKALEDDLQKSLVTVREASGDKKRECMTGPQSVSNSRTKSSSYDVEVMSRIKLCVEACIEFAISFVKAVFIEDNLNPCMTANSDELRPRASCSQYSVSRDGTNEGCPTEAMVPSDVISNPTKCEPKGKSRLSLPDLEAFLSFFLGQLFIACSAILKLNMQIELTSLSWSLFPIVQDISEFMLVEFSRSELPNQFALFLLDGVVRFLEELGNYFPHIDPSLSQRSLHQAYSLALEGHWKAVERALVGVWGGSMTNYEIVCGNLDGGEVASVVSAGIVCLDSILEYVTGPRRLNLIKKKHIQNLVAGLFNIILHLQGPRIFYGYVDDSDVPMILERETRQCIALLQDSVTVLLHCVETVNTKHAPGREIFEWEIQVCAGSLRRIYEEEVCLLTSSLSFDS